MEFKQFLILGISAVSGRALILAFQKRYCVFDETSKRIWCLTGALVEIVANSIGRADTTGWVKQ
jgi:hypothetical protein